MRRWLLAALPAVLIGAAPLTAQAPAGRAGAGDGAIRGVVTDRASAIPVAGAHVLLVGTPLRTATDERGEFRFVDITPGRYAVRILSIGFAPLSSDVRVRADSTAELAVALDRMDVQVAGITVTATGAAEKVGESAVSVAVVERDEILRRGTIQIQDALPFVPGLAMDHGQVDIRGSSGLAGGIGSRVLMLLDGHPVLTGDGGEVDFEVIPMLDLARAEVVKGSHSALSGSAAMGGVVNLITSPIEVRQRTDLKLHYGAYDVPREFRFTDGRLDFQGVDLQHSREIGPVGVRVALGRELLQAKYVDVMERNQGAPRSLLLTGMSTF